MPCPMCGATDQLPGTRVEWSTIWRELEAKFGTTIPADMRARYETGDATNLGPCRSCGLRYFSPATAGTPDFYALLDRSGGYYDEVKWEAQVIGSMVRPDDAIVDLGAGAGGFLRSLPRERPGRTVGVDHYAAAIDSLRAAGIEGSTDDFEVFAEREAGGFDVACAIQVLEHVPDVAPLIRSCARLVRPGGRIFVAVPNHDRDRDAGFEPLDHPPHHVSRWTEADFHTLAERFGLEVVQSWREPAGRQAFRRALERRLPGRRLSWFVSRVVARLTPARIAAVLLARLAPDASTDGHTLLVELATSQTGA